MNHRFEQATLFFLDCHVNHVAFSRCVSYAQSEEFCDLPNNLAGQSRFKDFTQTDL